MKPFLEVEKDRKEYHLNSFKNTVHRSSLLIPKIKNNNTYISFLNHFLLKRNYKNVVIKITAYNNKGESGESRTFEINELKVYCFFIEKLLGDQFSCYQIEFFSSNNLFIPFPAVIINHVSKFSINTVHSFNRILNDSKEDDLINKVHLKEASIDFALSKSRNTFFIFQSGLLAIKEKSIEIIIEKSNETRQPKLVKIPITIPKMSIRKFNLNEVLKDLDLGSDISPGEYTLRILQPKQEMFYGRLLVGIEEVDNGSFTANHSYYDNSTYEEYFDSKSSFRTFAYFKNSTNQIRIYPVMSSGQGIFSIHVNFKNENKMHSKILREYKFDNTHNSLAINLNELIRKSPFASKDIHTYTINFTNKKENRVPTRINMQIIYGSEIETNINASINNSLLNEKIFSPKNKGSFRWLQIINHRDYESKTKIFFASKNNINNSSPIKVNISFYDSRGCFMEKDIFLNILDSYLIKNEDLKSDEDFIWCVAKSEFPNLDLCTFHTNLISNFSSGEHSF